MHAKKSNQLGVVAVIIMIVLLLLNAYLLYNNYNQKKTIQDQEEQVKATNQLKLDLEKEYYNALSNLEELRGSNDDLNEMIEEQKGLLKDQKTQISRLISENNDLHYVRNKIEEMRLEADSYLTEIRTLNQQVEELSESNVRLKAEKEELAEIISSERERSDSLVGITEITKIEKAKVEQENVELSKTVAKASTIDVIDIDVKSYNMEDDGKLKRRRRAKNINLIEICFETTANEIAEIGNEQFLVRVIDPQGKTMVEEQKGSGTFTNKGSNATVEFTLQTQVRYNKTPSVVCTQWHPDIEFADGVYEVEVYNKGHLAGKSTFKLR